MHKFNKVTMNKYKLLKRLNFKKDISTFHFEIKPLYKKKPEKIEHREPVGGRILHLDLTN